MHRHMGNRSYCFYNYCYFRRLGSRHEPEISQSPKTTGTNDAQSPISGRQWGFHKVRGDIGLEDHHLFPGVVEVVGI